MRRAAVVIVGVSLLWSGGVSAQFFQQQTSLFISARVEPSCQIDAQATSIHLNCPIGSRAAPRVSVDGRSIDPAPARVHEQRFVLPNVQAVEARAGGSLPGLVQGNDDSILVRIEF